jgi:predicted dehydrogenase
VGLQVLEAGVNLFIEKPAAPTVEGARSLVDAAARNGVVGQVGHMMRHSDPVRIAHDISHSEEFGEILSVESKYTTWPTGAAGAGWGGADEDWSYMLIQGCHPIDLMRHFVGEIVRVGRSASTARATPRCSRCRSKGRTGAWASSTCRTPTKGWYTGLEIVGDRKGIVRVDDLGRVTYRKGEKRVPAEKEPWGHSQYVWEPHHMLTHWRRAGYGNQLKAFARAILDKTPTYPSLHDGWRNLVVARAILEASASRSVVEVPQAERIADWLKEIMLKH